MFCFAVDFMKITNITDDKQTLAITDFLVNIKCNKLCFLNIILQNFNILWQPVFLRHHITDLSHKAALISISQTSIMKYISLVYQKKIRLEANKEFLTVYFILRKILMLFWFLGHCVLQFAFWLHLINLRGGYER